MAILLITFNLKKTDSTQKFDTVLSVLKGEKNWAKFSDYCYGMDTNMSPHQVYEKMKPYLDIYDTVLIFNIIAPYYGQHSKEVIDWASKKLNV